MVDMGLKTKQIKDIALIAVLAAVLFAQQIALSFIPNISFTALLVILYMRLLGFKKTTMIIFVHVISINLLSPFGPVMPLHIPSMLIGWMLIPILLSTIFKGFKSVWTLSIFGFIFGFVYGWMFIPVSVFALGIPFMEYLLMDLIFELIMGISNFLAILWLYEPMYKFLEHQLHKYYQ